MPKSIRFACPHPEPARCSIIKQIAEGIVKALRAQVGSATGAGDAFVAGILYAELTGLSTAEAAVFGTGAALLALAAGDTVSKAISPESIQKIMEGNYELQQAA